MSTDLMACTDRQRRRCEILLAQVRDENLGEIEAALRLLVEAQRAEARSCR